jgi:hypothetical protein
VPAIPHEVLAGSRRLGELRGEALHPPVDRDVVDLDAAFRQELLDVSIGKTEPQVLADRQGDDLGREAVPGEGRSGRWSDRRIPA